jgi:ferritin-like metal-binding protein YciE
MASKLGTLEDLYEDLLKDLYSAEKQLVKALPKMAKTAESEDLQRAFKDHLGKTQQHVERLEQIFSKLGGSPRGKKCVGMEGLIEEGSELMKEILQQTLDEESEANEKLTELAESHINMEAQ